MSNSRTRRRFLTATAAVLGGLGLVTTSDADVERTFVLEQDDDCFPVVPLEGDEPVEAFYDWGRDELSWSSEGTRELQRSETSLLFLYRGPLGLSLVVVHDRADDGTPGGVASFTFEGVPADAEWAVKDDLYEKSSNADTWEINGTVLEANESTVTDDIPDIDGNETVVETNETDNEATGGDTPAGGNATDNETDSEATGDDTPTGGNATEYDERTDEIDWFWTTGRTDGGALRGLAVDGLEMEIDAAFDEEAELDMGSYERATSTWTLLSGDRKDPDRTELALDSPVTLRTGTCEDGETTEAEEETASDEADEEGDQETPANEAEADEETPADEDEAAD